MACTKREESNLVSMNRSKSPPMGFIHCGEFRADDRLFRIHWAEIISKCAYGAVSAVGF
jgi:hypothetical protein